LNFDPLSIGLTLDWCFFPDLSDIVLGLGGD
jgi:hypothetical protein